MLHKIEIHIFDYIKLRIIKWLFRSKFHATFPISPFLQKLVFFIETVCNNWSKLFLYDEIINIDFADSLNKMLVSRRRVEIRPLPRLLSARQFSGKYIRDPQIVSRLFCCEQTAVTHETNSKPLKPFVSTNRVSR